MYSESKTFIGFEWESVLFFLILWALYIGINLLIIQSKTEKQLLDDLKNDSNISLIIMGLLSVVVPLVRFEVIFQ